MAPFRPGLYCAATALMISAGGVSVLSKGSQVGPNDDDNDSPQQSHASYKWSLQRCSS
jgi:hypothetical protein